MDANRWTRALPVPRRSVAKGREERKHAQDQDLLETVKEASGTWLAPERRAEVYAAIKAAERRQSIPALVAALENRHGGIREAAVAALARLGDHRAGGAVLGALRDEDPFVRIAAAAALPCVLEREEALPHLVETLHDADDEVRARVAMQLGALDASASVEPLLELVRAEQAGSRAQRAAVEALEMLEAGETVRTRRSRLNSPLLLWVAGVVLFGLGVVLAETSGMGLTAGAVGVTGFLLLVGFRVQAARGADQHAYFYPAGDLGGGEAVWLGAAADDGGWGDVGGADGGGDFGGDLGGL